MARKTTVATAIPSPTPRPGGASTSSSIAWPSISRTQATTLSPVYPGIIQIDRFFDSPTTKRFCAFLDSPTSPIALTPPVPGPPKRGNADRTNDRFGVDDVEFARALWEDSGLRELAEEGLDSSTKRRPCGLNPNIRLYRYTPGAYFGREYCVRIWDDFGR